MQPWKPGVQLSTLDASEGRDRNAVPLPSKPSGDFFERELKFFPALPEEPAYRD